MTSWYALCNRYIYISKSNKSGRKARTPEGGGANVYPIWVEDVFQTVAGSSMNVSGVLFFFWGGGSTIHTTHDSERIIYCHGDALPKWNRHLYTRQLFLILQCTTSVSVQNHGSETQLLPSVQNNVLRQAGRGWAGLHEQLLFWNH